MNAHISRDLPFALARTGLREPDGQSGQADFNRVNGLLGGVTPGMLHEESAHFDPTLTSTVLPATQLDPSKLQQLLSAWRGEASAKRRATARGANARATRPGRADDRTRRRGARAADRFTNFKPSGRPRCRAA